MGPGVPHFLGDNPCIAAINASHAFVADAQWNYVVNLDRFDWKKVEDSNYARRFHGPKCGLVSGGREVALNNGEMTNILDLETLTWRYGFNGLIESNVPSLLFFLITIIVMIIIIS